MDVLLKSVPVFRTDGTVYLTRLNQNVQFLDSQKLVLGDGSDASIYYDGTDLVISSADVGSGVLKFGTHSSSSDAEVSGYVTIKDSGGTSRKRAVIS